jgi:hypothetical protein
VVSLAPRALEEIVRPRRLAGVGARPLNFTVRPMAGVRHRSMKRIYVAAAIGFCVPIFWGGAGFVLFNAPQSTLTDMFWYAVYVTCPSWLLPENSASWILTPTLNGLTYCFLWWVVLALFQRYRRARSHE